MDAPQELDPIEVEASRPDSTQEMRDVESQNLRQATDMMGQLDPNSVSVGVDAFMSKMPQATPDMQQAPQNQMGEIMKSAPIFMGLAALGGKVFKTHGLAMLGATNAMMKGYASGSEQQYKNAMIDYQQKWKELAQKQQTYVDVWRSIYEARKGQFDAHIKASETANRIIGESDKNFVATQKLTAQIEQWKQKGDEESAKIDLQLQNLALRSQVTQATVDNLNARTAKTNSESSAGLSERAQQIVGYIASLGVPMPVGARNKTTFNIALNQLDKENPELTPEQIAQKMKTGAIKMKTTLASAAAVAKKEGLTASGMAALQDPGGVFDQLLEVGKKINFGDAKVINSLKLAAQGKFVADENIQAYRALVEDARTELSNVLSRGGQVTETVRKQAADMIPLPSSFGELQRTIKTSSAVGQAVLRGNNRVLEAIQNGQPMSQIAALAGVPPNPTNPNDAHKIGDTIQTKSGKTAVWDGTQWVYQ